MSGASLCLLATLILQPPSAAADPPDSAAWSATPDSSLRASARYLLLNPAPRQQAPVPEQAGVISLAQPMPSRWLDLPAEPPPRTRFHRMMHRADRRAHRLGLLGTLGSVLGVWDERVAWYLMAAGAVWGTAEGPAEPDSAP